MKKYYAVKNGRKTGIFDNWEACRIQIEGYSGAKYKAFKNYDEAKKFIDNQVESTLMIRDNEYPKQVKAYVDGSYSEEYKKYSYGCVLIYEDKILKLNGVGDKKEYVTMRNVAGELLGVTKAIRWAYENRYSLITIYYDYEGIEKWANGIWKTNKIGTKDYCDFIEKYRKYININFIKVTAHSGDFYNEEADKLAKNAFIYEHKINDERSKNQISNIDIFNKIMDMEDTNKNTIKIFFKGYTISESKLKKFVKEMWVLDGNEKNNIDCIDLNVNTETSQIKWMIKERNGNENYFDIKI